MNMNLRFKNRTHIFIMKERGDLYMPKKILTASFLTNPNRLVKDILNLNSIKCSQNNDDFMEAIKKANVVQKVVSDDFDLDLINITREPVPETKEEKPKKGFFK